MYFSWQELLVGRGQGRRPEDFQSNNSNPIVAPLVGGYRRWMVLGVFYVVLFTNRMFCLNTNMLSVL